ncbi:MAG TPA: HK97 gp10 family phage protein [bacterium]|nr:HK97 gp10 family phage protein [bacterium]
MPKDRWFTNKVMKNIRTKEMNRLQKASLYLVGKIKNEFQVINIANAIETGDMIGRSIKRVRKGKGTIGSKPAQFHAASRPGEPPAVDTGRLKRSINHRIGIKASGIFARVGTNVKYARRLEFGFTGIDSKGRKYDQKPRPFMHVTYRRELPKIKSILKTGRA